MNEGSLDALEARLGATTEWIRVCWCGLNGVWKCKMVARGALATLVQRGVGLTKADPGLILASDSCAWGSSVGEVRLLPEWSTLRILPHCPSHAAVYGTADWALDARRFLGAQLARLHERHGLSVRAAFEEEFYLLRGSDAEGWKPLDSTTYASVDALQRAWPVLDAMTRALTAQGIAIELLHAESGGGQFEIVWSHKDALAAADAHMAAKETIVAVARAQGFKATFVPKISSQSAGSGAHMHFSLWRGDQTIMEAFPDATSEAAQFIAGTLHHLPALCAIGCATTNSYKRIEPGMFAGAYQCWGYSNKEAPLRVCNWTGQGDATGTVRDVEFKCVDGTANPYLWLGAVIAAGLDGLANSRTLPAPVGADMSGQPRLPQDLKQALAALADNSVLRDAFGSDLFECFLAVKTQDAAIKAADLSVLLERF